MTFDLARITSDDTKYRYVVTNLDHTVLPFVMDVLASPPARGKYEEIKKRIIEAFDESHETKLRKLLRGSEVVDEKPSHCLQRLRNLAGGQVEENVLRTLFLEQLPESMRTVLAISDTADLQRLALLADKIAEMSVPRVAAIEASTPVIPPPSTRIEALEAKVEKLVSMVETLTARQSRQPYRSQPRWRPRGADISVLPHRSIRGEPAITDSKIYAANGTPISTFGSRRLTLNLGLRRPYTWEFIVAKVQQPIIGADFLKRFGLLLDLRNKRLIDELTKIQTTGFLQTATQTSLTTVDINNPYRRLLQEFIAITRTVQKQEVPAHQVRHHIVTRGSPVAERARRLPPEKLKAAKAEVDHLIAAGICQPSSSQWASPLHMVQKKNGGWRLCGDYRRLNSITVPDKYPLPHVQDFAHRLDGTTVFTTLDLTWAYHQIPINPEDRAKTAIITLFGLYEFNVMTFGLKNAAQSFQRFMDDVLRGLNFVFCFVDDILIASANELEHKEHLRCVFERLKAYGLSINLSKSVFGAHSVQYLGYLTDSMGARPVPEKVEAIKNYNKPKTIADLRRFLGSTS
ncbi:uncharacterized protein K02A2.6-like [Osmia bicornis bicornis]|uniref:uncharacterized protein K02A2.6-like n=1 Tax=Osmia bicornis bicornis TaxID=1437191 RepID=UPI001EAECE6D|nr:uncharacterized protein K02A2.6-like [Osmia bicornis bicornis]